MYYTKRDENHLDKVFILASMKKRLAAFLIDFVILIILYSSIIKILDLFNVEISKINVISIFDVEVEMNITNPTFILFLKVFFGFLPVIYFSVLSYLLNGQTIGKFILKIKIVSLYHGKFGFWHSFERSLGYFASALEFGFGFIQAFWNPNRMTLHDKIGETIVINLRARKPK